VASFISDQNAISALGSSELGTEMKRQAIVALYVLLMVAVIVGVDFLFLRNRFWERLMVNIGIVLIFAALYLSFLKPR